MPNSPPSRAAARPTETADVDAVIVAVVTVQDAAMLVCAARLETGLDHNEFRDLVNELIDAARADERMRVEFTAKMLAPPPKPKHRRFPSVPEDVRAAVRAGYEHAATINGGKAPRGTLAALAKKHSLDVVQVTTLVYK